MQAYGIGGLVLAMLSFVAPAWAAEGDLDPTFGTGGVVNTPVAEALAVNTMAIDAQGRILVVGDVRVLDSEFGVARYLPNGALDTSFGVGGTAVFDFPVAASIEHANAVALDAQGRILIAGHVQTQNIVDFALIRLTPDGAIDSSFGPPGSNGFVRQPVFSSDDSAQAVAVDAQGRIVLGGTTLNGDDDFAVVRYDPNGILDPNFGTGGKQSVDFTSVGGDTDSASAMAIDGQGRILLAGSSDTAATPNSFALARLNSDGTRDTSFGPPPAGSVNAGQVSTPIGSDAAINEIAIDPQGRIVAAGQAEDAAGFQFALARYNPDGSLDTTFSDDGTLLTSIQDTPTGFEQAFGVGIDSRGRVVASGHADDGVDQDSLALARYQPDGALDATFGSGGKVLLPGREGTTVDFDAQDRIVVASTLLPGGPDPERQFGAARFIGDAVPPPPATIQSGPAEGAVTNDSTPTFGFAGGEADGTFACGFDGTSAPCPSPFTPGTPLSDGQHTLSVVALDRAINASAPATRTFTVDTVAPEITIKGKKKLETDASKAKGKLKIKTSEPAELTCKVDKKKPKPCDEKFKAKFKLGKHKVKVTATDQAGNFDTEKKKIKVVSAP